MKDIEERLGYITVTDLITIIESFKKHKDDNILYDVKFSQTAKKIQEFVQAIMLHGYWSNEVQEILNEFKDRRMK